MRVWQVLSQAGASLSVTVALLALPGTSPLPDAAPPMQPAVDMVPLPVVPPAAPAPPAPVPHDVVALGDSVPSGAACGCTPYPELYAALLGRAARAPVTVTNRAVGGLQSSGLLAQLQQASTASAVRRADVVLVTIGANDLEDHEGALVDGSCGERCVAGELATLRARLGAVLARIRALRSGQATTVLVTGYWNVFRDGPVAKRAYGASGLRTAIGLTRAVNGVLEVGAAQAGARYVDLFTPFQHSGSAIGTLLASDGDHPDAAGHRLIAQTLLAAGLPRVG